MLTIKQRGFQKEKSNLQKKSCFAQEIEDYNQNQIEHEKDYSPLNLLTFYQKHKDLLEKQPLDNSPNINNVRKVYLAAGEKTDQESLNNTDEVLKGYVETSLKKSINPIINLYKLLAEDRLDNNKNSPEAASSRIKLISDAYYQIMSNKKLKLEFEEDLMLNEQMNNQGIVNRITLAQLNEVLEEGFGPGASQDPGSIINRHQTIKAALENIMKNDNEFVIELFKQNKTLRENLHNYSVNHPNLFSELKIQFPNLVNLMRNNS